MASPSEHIDGSASQHGTKAAQDPPRGHEQEDQSTQSSRRDSEAPSNPPLPDGEEQPPLPEGEDPPPLPSNEAPPPLPEEEPPGKQQPEDDGWEPIWDDNLHAYYFYNRITNATQWENPRVPETTAKTAPQKRPHGGYDPAIHGNYDPNADYAQVSNDEEAIPQPAAGATTANSNSAAPDYSAAGHFNRFTGKWQADSIRSENYSDEAKSQRQMGAFFDVDAAANSHDGKSLRAERANKKLSKAELKAFKEKRKEKKEEKRRAWLRD